MKFLSRLALMLVLVLPLYAQTQTFPAEDMSNTFTGTNINGAVTRNGNGAGGNIPIQPASTDSIQYVDSAGNDSNDGLSMGSAKLTIMAAYDALSSAGGTINICVQGGATIAATSRAGQGIWIMGSSDPNYSSPPAGWRKVKAVSFVGMCGNNSNQQGNKPQVAIGAGSARAPGIWLSSMNTSVSFANLSIAYPVIDVQLGVDSNGNQTSTSGVYGASFDNLSTFDCNSCSSSAGPGWNIGGGDTNAIFINNVVAQGNPKATVGADNQAAILIKPTSSSNAAVGVSITNSVTASGGIKYYEGTNTGSLYVNNAISESIAGGSPGIGTVWVTSDIASIINVSNLAVADNTGTVYALRVDGTIGLNATLAATGYFQGGIKGPVSIVGLSGATATDPLVQGQTGFSNGRFYGFVGNTQRQFAP